MKRIFFPILLLFPVVLYAQPTIYPPIGSNNGFSSFSGALNSKGPFILPRMDSAKNSYGVYTDLYINKDSVLMWNNPTTKKSYPVFTGEQGATMMPVGWNIIYTSPNVYDSHQGVAFDSSGFAYCIASDKIVKRNAKLTNWPIIASNNTALAGFPAAINHLGGGKVYKGKLYLAVERYVACGNASLFNIAVYDTSTLALLSYHSVDSIPEISGLCFTPNGHIWVTSFCDSLHLFEYDSAYNFIGKKDLTIPISSQQGICYNPTESVFYVSSNYGRIYQVQLNGTVDSILFNTFNNGVDAFEDIDFHDGVIKWTKLDNNNASYVYYISDKKTAKDYAILNGTAGGIQYGSFNIVGNNNDSNNPTLYVASQNGKATIVLNSVTGMPADVIFEVGGRKAFDISARGSDVNGNMYIYRSSNGTSFDAVPLLNLNRFTGAVAINQSAVPVNTLEVGGAIKATQFKISALNTAPASATATGTIGEVRITANYIYVCTATNTWVRASLSTW